MVFEYDKNGVFREEERFIISFLVIVPRPRTHTDSKFHLHFFFSFSDLHDRDFYFKTLPLTHAHTHSHTHTYTSKPRSPNFAYPATLSLSLFSPASPLTPQPPKQTSLTTTSKSVDRPDLVLYIHTIHNCYRMHMRNPHL